MKTTEKTCFKCDKTKPLGDFYKHKQMGDGHLNKCKECTKADVAAHREANLEDIRAYDRMRYRRDEYRKAQYRMLSLGRTPEQKKCHDRVGNAIRDGRLIRPDGCWGCGDECKPEAHHVYYDPDRFDDVTWLCRSCHIKAHKIS